MTREIVVLSDVNGYLKQMLPLAEKWSMRRIQRDYVYIEEQ